MNCVSMLCRWFLYLAMLALVSCASRPPTSTSHQEQGWASYIADHHTGRPTASGELYYPQAYTAAHASLPFGSVVTVQNIMNGRTVNVTINDRFPYYQGRVINLSSIAAQHIGIPYMQMGQVNVIARSIPQQNYGYANHGGYQQNYASQQSSYSQQQYNYQSTANRQQSAYRQTAPTNRRPASNSGYYAPSNQWQHTSSRSPSAPGYSGSNASPPGLKTY